MTDFGYPHEVVGKALSATLHMLDELRVSTVPTLTHSDAPSDASQDAEERWRTTVAARLERVKPTVDRFLDASNMAEPYISDDASELLGEIKKLQKSITWAQVTCIEAPPGRVPANVHIEGFGAAPQKEIDRLRVEARRLVRPRAEFKPPPLPAEVLAIDPDDALHANRILAQDSRAWQFMGQSDEVATVYFESTSPRDLTDPPPSVAELIKQLHTLDFTTELSLEFKRSANALEEIALTILASAAGLVLLNSALKAAEEIPERWRRLVDLLKGYPSVRVSPDLLFDIVRSWLDQTHGKHQWSIDHSSVRLKRISRACVLFEFLERSSNTRYRVQVLDWEVSILNAEVLVLAADPADQGAPAPASSEARVTDSDAAARPRERSDTGRDSASHPTKASSALPAIDLLLVVATDIEQAALVDAWKLFTNRSESPRILHGKRRSYEDLGVISGARVAVVQTRMGTATVGGSLSTTHAAIDELNPRYVIMVGIAFGVDPDKQPIGTVLVARQVHPYQVQRVGTRPDGTQVVLKRGDKATASPDVLSRLQVANRQRPATFGLLLSGESLVDNHDYREELRSFEPEALGGEMEGGGIYVAATEARIGWCIVKAVCDWADGNKAQDKDERQRTAARNAAEYVLRAVDAGGFASAGTRPAEDPS